MTIPRHYTVSTPFGTLSGSVKEIVAAYNAIVNAKGMPSKHRLAISSFSRLVTGKNKSRCYKTVRMAKP
jgi:hypothetical protein